MPGKHAADLPVHVRRCHDNMAYLWYFDKATEIGFEWTGSLKDPVELSHGGFGEPITNIIDVNKWDGFMKANITAPNRTLEQMVAAFQFFCKDWVQGITADIHAQEPQMVINSGDVNHG